jgi:NAD(P)-dependent dehydrogenase (short-subunit alcohol dehydrogenase family)
MSLVVNDLGVPNLAIYSVQGFSPGRALDVDVPAFEECWRQNCLGGFIVARESAREMSRLGRGTIALIGSTSGLIGRADHLNLAVGKFGLRALAQVMSRELWTVGIHVVHVVIDADIKEDEAFDPAIPQSDPKHIAELLYALHRQPKSAWTSEIDVRPWNESFWEHC